ncbi:MAG: hypothetical protein WC595_04120 [Candidatus Nanoarchaeia archaeon]
MTNLSYAVGGFLKSTARGIWVGGLLAMPLAYVLDYSLGSGFIEGAFVVAVLDTKQFSLRCVWNYLEKQTLG